MAKYRRGSKIQPAPLTMSFAMTLPASASSNHYIDLSQAASLVNRRFYRQGINWAVAGFKIAAGGTTSGGVFTPFEGTFIISKLPNTWVMSNAWMKAFKAWQKMNNDALSENESVRPKFLDFKIYADADHHAAGFAANLMPQSVTGSFATPGEWVPSKIVQPDSSQGTPTVYDRELIAVGANYPGAGASGLNAVSLIEGYAASRGLPNVLDPNTPVDADDADGTAPQNWMAAMFNEGQPQDAEVIEDLTDDNNIAPYPFENDGVHVDTMYPGGANQLVGLEWHDVEGVTGTTIGNITRMKGGNFPCGLIKIQGVNITDQQQFVTLQLDLIPGKHRGYLCEPMTEM